MLLINRLTHDYMDHSLRQVAEGLSCSQLLGSELASQDIPANSKQAHGAETSANLTMAGKKAIWHDSNLARKLLYWELPDGVRHVKSSGGWQWLLRITYSTSRQAATAPPAWGSAFLQGTKKLVVWRERTGRTAALKPHKSPPGARGMDSAPSSGVQKLMIHLADVRTISKNTLYIKTKIMCMHIHRTFILDTFTSTKENRFP